MKGWAVSFALVGCIAEALVIGWPGDHFGRKATLQFQAVLFLVSAIGSRQAIQENVLFLFQSIHPSLPLINFSTS